MTRPETTRAGTAESAFDSLLNACRAALGDKYRDLPEQRVTGILRDAIAKAEIVATRKPSPIEALRRIREDIASSWDSLACDFVAAGGLIRRIGQIASEAIDTADAPLPRRPAPVPDRPTPVASPTGCQCGMRVPEPESDGMGGLRPATAAPLVSLGQGDYRRDVTAADIASGLAGKLGMNRDGGGR